jgi:hypothetical protein
MTDNDRLHELLRVAREAAQEQLTEPALRERFGTPDNWPLRPGAVWRARWDNVAVLVLLVDTPTATSVAAAPVTFDAGAGDQDTLTVPAPTERRVSVTVTVWRALRRDMPLAVLDRPIDELEPAVVAWVNDGPIPDDARLNRPALSPGAPGNPVRAELDDDLDTLVAAMPALIPTPPLSATAQSRKRVSPSDNQYAALTDRLGVGLPALLDLIDGKREANPTEAAALREILGVTPDVDPPPAALIVEMSHPRWKVTVLDLAQRDHLDEGAARMAMANGTVSLAARQTGEQTPDWRERLARWAAAEGLKRS